MPGDDDMGQCVTPTDNTLLQEKMEEIISFICNNQMSSDMHTKKEDNQVQIKVSHINAHSTRVSKIRLTIFLIVMVATQMHIIAAIK